MNFPSDAYSTNPFPRITAGTSIVTSRPRLSSSRGSIARTNHSRARPAPRSSTSRTAPNASSNSDAAVSTTRRAPSRSVPSHVTSRGDHLARSRPRASTVVPNVIIVNIIIIIVADARASATRARPRRDRLPHRPLSPLEASMTTRARSTRRRRRDVGTTPWCYQVQSPLE